MKLMNENNQIQELKSLLYFFILFRNGLLDVLLDVQVQVKIKVTV